MTILQKKQKLIEETEKLTDGDFIEYLLRLIEGETAPNASKIYRLTEMEKKAIDEAETDIKEGKVITNKEADEQIKSWL
ncbi:MAG: hypothetical protein EA359_03505 [Balneolaceae bacterium]|nr:MAG: hypothetical protein EA359_03505 [Balneolaceae bacterium]